jgi:hypothetical protein
VTDLRCIGLLLRITAKGGRSWSFRFRDPVSVMANGIRPDASRFHDSGYRSILRKMIALAVATEAPIYEDVLVDRVARAHGFQRSGNNICQIISGVLVESFCDQRMMTDQLSCLMECRRACHRHIARVCMARDHMRTFRSPNWPASRFHLFVFE